MGTVGAAGVRTAVSALRLALAARKGEGLLVRDAAAQLPRHPEDTGRTPKLYPRGTTGCVAGTLPGTVPERRDQRPAAGREKTSDLRG